MTHRAEVVPGTAMRILTGAMLPPGADAVVRVEDTDAPAGVADLPASVAIHVAVAPGTVDPPRGAATSGPVTWCCPLAASWPRTGSARWWPRDTPAHAVHGRPRVAILSTGDELVPAGEPLHGAGIPDSSSAALAAQASEAGAEVMPLGIAPDDRDAIIERLSLGVAGADIVVASGGVSVGPTTRCGPRSRRSAASTCGASPSSRASRLRSVGHVPTMAAAVLLFGLPGNPVSSFVTFELFVRPVIRRMAGHKDLRGRTIVRARLADQARTDPGRRTFLRVRLVPEQQGGWIADLAGGQGSHMLSGLAAADGLAIVPEGIGQLEAGAEVDVIRLDTGGGMPAEQA